jgi:hypothetical protein
VAVPRWLKLTRSDGAEAAYDSTEGTTGSARSTATACRKRVEGGLLVTSSLNLEYVQAGGAEGIGIDPTEGRLRPLEPGIDLAGYMLERRGGSPSRRTIR